MNRLILILFLAIIFFSCEDEYDYIKNWQRLYINEIFNNPYSIDIIINDRNEIGKFPTESRWNFVNKDTLLKYIEYIKIIKQYGYTIEFQDPWMFREANSRKVHFCNEIIVKAKCHDFYMVFRFQTERNKFNLVKIDTGLTTIYKGKKDLSLRDTVLKENERFIDLMMKNPEQLTSVIDNSDYYSESCRYYMNDDSLKLYSRHIKNLTEFGYEIYHREVYYFGGSMVGVPGLSICLDDQVVIKGKMKEIYLSIYFSSENDKEILCNIYNDKRTLNQQVSEFKYPNE